MEDRLKSFARYGGIVAIALEWLTLLIFYAQEPSDFSGQHPISYFATLPQTRLLFSLGYSLAAISFWIFTTYHLNKHYRTPTRMFALSMLGFAGVAIVPFSFTNPATLTIHSVLALGFSLTFGAGMYFMARHNEDRSLRYVSLAAVVLEAILLTLLLVQNPSSRLVLVFEASAGFICQFWIVWMSWHAYRK